MLYYTVQQFSERNPIYSSAALRNLIFKAQKRHTSKGVISGNGLIEMGAIYRVGRKILINEENFFSWIEAQQGETK